MLAGGDIEREAALRADGAVVLKSLRELPPEQRRVLVLAYFAGLSQTQIATATGAPVGTVKKRVRLGLQELRAALDSQQDEEPIPLRLYR